MGWTFIYFGHLNHVQHAWSLRRLGFEDSILPRDLKPQSPVVIIEHGGKKLRRGMGLEGGRLQTQLQSVVLGAGEAFRQTPLGSWVGCEANAIVASCRWPRVFGGRCCCCCCCCNQNGGDKGMLERHNCRALSGKGGRGKGEGGGRGWRRGAWQPASRPMLLLHEPELKERCQSTLGLAVKRWGSAAVGPPTHPCSWNPRCLPPCRHPQTLPCVVIFVIHVSYLSKIRLI